MRLWQPKNKSKLPSPRDKFCEYESAIYWHYKLDEWKALPLVMKAQCMAHFLEAKMREAYSMETDTSAGNDNASAVEYLKKRMYSGSLKPPGVS